VTVDGTHPRHDLDSVIHAPVRLSIMAALAASDRIEFRLLRDTVEVSDSLLSKHIVTLENAGYLLVTKGYVGKRPRTWLSLTPEGRSAFARYADTLRTIVNDGGISTALKEPTP
jgi:DNA-binding MarR family transcriptional regulator